MLYSLRGALIHREPGLAVIECSGVGYACRTTFATGAALGAVGDEVRVFTVMQVREDAVELFGFADRQELACFNLLIGVSGVGPKAALSILSDLEPARFLLTVAAGDSKTLTKTKGIGAKIAQRIVLELKDKVAKQQPQLAEEAGFAAVAAAPADGAMAEALSALMVLGYTQGEVAPVLAGLPDGLSSSELIKQTLRAMGGNK